MSKLPEPIILYWEPVPYKTTAPFPTGFYWIKYITRDAKVKITTAPHKFANNKWYDLGVNGTVLRGITAVMHLPQPELTDLEKEVLS